MKHISVVSFTIFLIFSMFLAIPAYTQTKYFMPQLTSQTPIELEDGSWLLVEPRYSRSESDGQEISYSVDRGLICKSLGFANAILSESITTPNTVISFNAFSNQIMYLKKRDPGGGMRYHAIVCRDDGAKTLGRISKNAQKITLNSDKSITIDAPAFHWIDGNINLTAHSDLNGICLLYGNEQYRSGTLKIENTKTKSLVINRYGRLEQFDFQGTNGNYLAISQITCDPSLEERFSENFSPLTFTRSLDTLSNFLYPLYAHALQNYIKIASNTGLSRSWPIHAYRMNTLRSMVQNLDATVIKELILPKMNAATEFAFKRSGINSMANLPKSNTLALSAIEFIQAFTFTLRLEAHFDIETTEILSQINAEASKLISIKDFAPYQSESLKDLVNYLKKLNQITGYGQGAIYIEDLKAYLPLVNTIQIGYQTLLNLFPELNVLPSKEP